MDQIHSKWIMEVTNEQQTDGSWGRFHSADSKLKRKWSTTESAMARLKYLGLDRTSKCVQKACHYCEILLNDLSLWPDYMEKNELFPKAVPIYITTALSHFGSEDLLYRQFANALLSLLNIAFVSDQYDYMALNEGASQYLGTTIHDTYIGLGSKYLIIFFHNHIAKIDKTIQQRYLKWIHKQHKIFYCSGSLKNAITPFSNLSAICERVEFLSKLSSFHGFSEEFVDDLNALLLLKQNDGYWDLGNEFKCPRLSENWRNPANRKIDQTYYLQRVFNNTP